MTAILGGMKATKPLSVLGVGLVSAACGALGMSKEESSRDVETTAAAACAPDDEVPALDPTTLFAGPREPSPTRPERGSRVAFEGVPQANILCSQRGCEFECCDNGCGSNAECTYALHVDAVNQVCLDEASFECGGTDCSPYCVPFSQSPKRRYRFVGTIDYRDGTLGTPPVLRIERYCALP